MNMLASLKTDDSIKEAKDSVGGNGPLESGIYNFNVALAYLGKAESGALSLNLHLKSDEGHELRQTLWMTSGKNKGGKNYYEKNGEKHYLPGFTLAEHLSLLTVGKSIADLDTEEKVVSLYSFEAQAEVPTKVQVLTDLLGKEVIGAVFKQTVDKTKKNESGEYLPTGETRDENELDKFFRARDQLTVAEIRAQASEPAFINTWRDKWAGKTRNRSKGANGNNGTAGAPSAAAQPENKPKNSLFG